MKKCRSARLLSLGLLPLFFGLSGCEEEATPSAEVTAVTPRMEVDVRWAHFSGNPILAAGDLRDGAMWNDPCVLPRAGGGYVMYLTTSVGDAFKPPVLPFRAVSEDGVDWKLDPETPLLSAEGSPFVSLETPSVVFFKGQYHLYYTGIFKPGTVPPMAIGHAVSEDGVNWRLVDEGRPVLSATGQPRDWNGYLVGEPGAVVFNDQIYLYFSAVGSRPGGNPPQEQVIGLAISADGHRFSDPRPVLKQSALFPPEAGFVGYSTPQPTLHAGKIHLFYDVARYDAKADPQWSQAVLQTAVSADGVSFEESPQPFAERSMFGWTQSEVRSPSALVEDGQWKVWYAGHGNLRDLFRSLGSTGRGEHFGIGLATRALSADR